MKERLTWLAQLPALVLLGLTLFWFLQGFSQRVVYPYDIEWMEGGMLVHVWRLRQGLGLYIEPSADFIPYIYPPFYPWLLSLLGEPSYAIGRSVSLAGTLAACAALVYALRGEGVRWGLALGAAGLFLSCYDESGTFYDIVRADALAIGLASWSLALVRRGSRPMVVAGGLLLVLAFLTKHNYAAFGLPMALWLWRAHGRRRALDFVLASAVPAGLMTVAIQVVSHGNFLTYLLAVPGSHPLVAERAWPTSELELATCLRWTNLGALVVLVGFGVRKRFSSAAAYWGANLLLAAGLCVLMRAHHGGFINVLMPGHWTLAVAGAAALGAFTKRFDHPLSVLAVSALLGWQTWDGRWDRTKGLPTEADYVAGELLISELEAIDGEVFAPHFAWYPAMAGKQPSLPLIALWDISHSSGPFFEESKVVEDAMCAHRWAAVLTPTGKKVLKHGLKRCYEVGERLPIKDNGLSTKTGWKVRPGQLWVPKGAPEPEPEEEARDTGGAGDER